jgi:hypothetical protein
MKNYDELIANIRGLFNDSTQGEWKKGATSHHTVTETGYKIGEFHHASDAAFCDYMHGRAVDIITAIQELQAEVIALTTDRDEWKDSTIAANQNAASEEARRRVMQMERDELRAKLAAIEGQEPVGCIGKDSLTVLYYGDSLPPETDLYIAAGAAPQAQDVNAELVEALETLCTGLEWHIENNPTAMNQSDEEALHDARAILAKAAPQGEQQ